MLRSLPSAVDDALDTLYEPDAVFSQFLGSASKTFFFFSLLFLASSSCLFLLLLFFLLFPFSFFHFLVFSFLPFVFFYFLCFFFPIDLRLSCVCAVIGTTMQYIRGSLSWVGSGMVGFSRRE